MSSSLTVKPSQRFRSAVRVGDHTSHTSGSVPGYVQTNVVILPKENAYDFLLFCNRNPKPCPLLEVLDAGTFESKQLAPGSDIRTDVPKYNVFRNGQLSEELEDISRLWRDDLVTFLLGCSYTFETALIQAGISLKHVSAGTNVAMFRTNVTTEPSGLFQGPLVVTMRPIHHSNVVKATQITSRYPGVHGAPVHIGDPSALGIVDLTKPDYGDPILVDRNETPIFWACGVTTHVAAINSNLPLVITHSPGCMFVTDIKDEDLSLF